MQQLTGISAFIQKHFPEREFHYRSGGAVRYFRLSTEMQVAVAGAVAFVLCWTVALTLWTVLGSSSGAQKAALKERLSVAAAEAKASKAEKDALRKQIAELRQKRAQTAKELSRSRNEFARMATLKKGMAPFRLTSKLPISATSRFLAAGISTKAGHAPNGGKPRTIFDTLSKSEETAIGAGVATMNFSIAGIKARNRTLVAERDQLWSRVAYLRAGIDRMRSGRAVLLTRLDKRTQRNIDEIERVIVMTGLDPDRLLGRLNKNGQGGPEIATPAAIGAADAYAVRVVRLNRKLERWERLQAVLRRMPLIAPLDHYRKSSGFGKRRDPITGRWSSHNGLDFAYHRNTPVLNTAAGTVTFAGWRGGYGWMIEIDHGMGIRTRYAHLKKVLVEKGQKLAFRDKIGLLGSSGRSSGPHVHYEVVVDGRPRNPMKFITAGKYVFKR